MNNKLKATGIVKEMKGGDISSVPMSPKVNYDTLIEGDSDPMFVTVEVMNPTISKNGRKWTPELMQSVAEQINEKLPDGYMGHLKDEDRATAHPEAQTMWVGAKVEEVDGTLRLLAKGYIYPYAEKLRTYLKKAIANGKQVAVSVYGEALQSYDKLAKIYNIKEFDLESIDWARSGSAGITPSFVPVIAREQVDENNMDKKLSEITLEELKELRPDLVDALKAELEAKPADPAPADPTPAPADPNPAPVEENGEVKEMRSIIGTENGKSVVSEMKNIMAEREVLLDAYIDSKVDATVGKESMKGIFRKMIVGEMKARNKESIDNAVSAVLESEEGKAFIAEMVKTPAPVNALDDNRNNSDNSSRKFTKVS